MWQHEWWNITFLILLLVGEHRNVCIALAWRCCKSASACRGSSSQVKVCLSVQYIYIYICRHCSLSWLLPYWSLRIYIHSYAPCPVATYLHRRRSPAADSLRPCNLLNDLALKGETAIKPVKKKTKPKLKLSHSKTLQWQ